MPRALRLWPLLACLALPSARAQDPPTPAGPTSPQTVWVIAAGGKEIGRERVRRAPRDGGGASCSSQADLTLPGAPRFRYEQRLEVDARGGLVGYELTSESIRAEASATETGARLERRYEGGGAGGLEVDGEGPFLVLDLLVWSHYEQVAERAAREGAFTATYLVPQRCLIEEARFLPGEPVAARLAGAATTLRRGLLRLGGQEAYLTYDPERGRACRVELPGQGLEAWVEELEAPPPADPQASEAWRELEVTIPAPAGPLPAVLTLPRQPATPPFPTALLLSDAGALDRDATQGPNKPFRDLARGLAARGVATLRCDKRSHLLAAQFQAGGAAARAAARQLEELTLRGEQLDDAQSALAWLATREEVGARLLVGHGLGGLAATELAAGRPEGVVGLALWAAPGRRYDAVVDDRVAAEEALRDGLELEEARRRVRARLAPQWAQVRSGELPADARVLNATARTWRDLLERDPPALLARVRLPVLLLQGSHDALSQPEDFERLREALQARPSAAHEARWLEGLNHLLMPCPDRSGAACLRRLPGQVAPAALDALAAWILQVARAR